MSTLNRTFENKQRTEIASDVDAFLAKGGVITRCKPRKARQFERPNWTPSTRLHWDGHNPVYAIGSTPLAA